VRIKRRLIALLAAVLAVAGPLRAAAEERLHARFNFRHYGDEQGLSNLAVMNIVQDRIGFLWVGTQDGLYRFDSREFVRFGREDGLPSSFIQSLHLDDSGTLWVGTGDGLARRQSDGFRAYGAGDGIPGGKVAWHGIAGGAALPLYVATERGLFTQSGGRFEPMRLPQPWSFSVTTLDVAGDGALWVAGSAHVGRLAAGKLEIWEAGLPNERIDDLLVDAGGEVFVRTANHLVSRKPGEPGFSERGRGLGPANYFGSLYLDRAGDLWATSDLGLARRRADGSWDVVDQGRGLNSGAVNAIYEDREGLLWVGMSGSGLDCWLGYPSWSAVTTAEGLSNDTVWSMTRGDDGALWVGTDAGLNRLDPASGRWRKLLPADGLAGLCAYALRPGVAGELWVGFLPGGVSRVDTRTGGITSYGAADGLAADRVYAVAPTADGGLWAGTSAGLYHAPPSTGRLRFERAELPGGDGRESFGAVLVDAKGRVWAGGEHGLALREHGRWRRFTSKDGLRDDYVFYLAEEPDGAVWVAYWEAMGASRLELAGDKPRFRNFDARSGLASDAVEFLGIDRRGRAWLGTSRGVNVLDAGRIEHYARADGLVWDSCNTFFEDSDGGFWIGTTRGLARFRPHPLPSPPPPTVTLLSTRLGGRTLPVDGRADVGYADRSLEVSFAGLAFRKAEETRFRYRLVGLEEAPTETSLREVRYAKLPAGEFVFEVAARNAAGAWSPAPARFRFRIRPPWYLTWWALSGGTLFSLAAGALAYKRRVAHLVEARERLEQAVAARTLELQREKKTVEEQAVALLAAAEERRSFYAMVVHDLKNPLTPILGGLELAEAKLSPEAPARRHLQLIRRAATRMLFLVEHFTTALRASSHEGGRGLDWQGFGTHDLLSDLALTYAAAVRDKRLALYVDGIRVDENWVPPRGGPPVKAPAEAVYFAVENLLSNALKYAASEIRMSVAAGEDVVLVRVDNDGPSIPDADKERVFGLFQQLEGAKPGTGVGLASARRQIEEVGGRIRVSDVEPQGARFEICLPRLDTRPAGVGVRPPGGA
jgi:signal transduction histidine kinase/ligand-binding sensor domain-containing protein